MNFGEAIKGLKAGKKVARAGWNGNGMFVWLNRGSFDHENFKDGFRPFFELRDGQPGDEFWEKCGDSFVMPMRGGISHVLFDKGDVGSATRLPNLNMRAANGDTVTGWLASQTDILAEDWVILP